MKNSQGLLLATCMSLFAIVGLSDAKSDPIGVKEVGSYFVGGREVTLSGLPRRELTYGPNNKPVTVDPNGQFEVGQLYVQYVTLAEPRAKYPLLMWHGGGLTGQTWETKPDGRPGWQSFFLRAGHDVFISDAVERGRSSWARFPEIYAGEPFHRTKEEAWTIFRIGPSWSGSAEKSPTFPGQQFPKKAFDQFFKGSVPRWDTNNAIIQDAYDALIEKACPCVLLIHSQAASFAFPAALKNPDKIKGIVAVEPSGAPPAAVSAGPLANIPFLFVWGDNIQENKTWVSLYSNLRRWQDQLKAGGASVTELRLPENGLTGNGHMLMMEDNSDKVASLIQSWMTDHDLIR